MRPLLALPLLVVLALAGCSNGDVADAEGGALTVLPLDAACVPDVDHCFVGKDACSRYLCDPNTRRCARLDAGCPPVFDVDAGDAAVE
jgi:hypothetical protein